MSNTVLFKKGCDNYLLEAFRVLRSNIYFLEKKENKIILFTSTIPNEGKTTVTKNYAMSVAITGKKVISVNCDIRRDKKYNNFGLDINYGIESVLAGEKEVDEVIIKNVEKNLDILPAKHLKNGVTGLFLGGRIKRLLEELRQRYDLVVLDTPPITIATDAAILSEYADGVIYICGYDMVTKQKMLRAKKLLERAGGRIYGVVINRIDKKAYAGNYGYEEYGKYDDYIKDELVEISVRGKKKKNNFYRIKKLLFRNL